MAQQEFDGHTYDLEEVRKKLFAHFEITTGTAENYQRVLLHCKEKVYATKYGVKPSPSDVVNDYIAYVQGGEWPWYVLEYYAKCVVQAPAT